ncbi:UNVERIFIED_CONTAM: hypothetical protein Slati_2649900 [Sesamum latifolium]|uniref:Myb/SANT-like domain-containing protein n=1 Tax=Sesamum latifolium TaxID=2727402 RepID=A0AAW2VXM3_9LAMI
MLEQLLRKKCPESGLKSDPHISSKIHVLKRTYACISDMLAKSGFGWNEAMQMIAVSDEVFDNYAKIDPFAKTLRFKSFPYYPSWSEIFGKDRATREYAEDIYNASNNVSIEAIPVFPEYYVPSSDINALAPGPLAPETLGVWKIARSALKFGSPKCSYAFAIG